MLLRAGRSVAIALAIAAASLTGCTTHSVGPARTYDDFERKSRTTAQVALSAVETVRLLSETATAGKAFAAYTNVSISEQEDTIGEARSDFESIQPPGDGADALRARLDPMLDAAIDHIAAVRIAARRGELGSLTTIGAPLTGDSDALQRFLDDIG
jgi:hypothetical protein